MTENPEDHLSGTDDAAERIKRWDEARHRALAEDITPREAFTTEFLERKKATMGINPTQEKARTLYEWWQSGCGAKEYQEACLAGDLRSFDRLHPYERERWAMLAKALGAHPYHERTDASALRKVEVDAKKYAKIPAGISWADYDEALHPEDATVFDKIRSYMYADLLTYAQWAQTQPRPRRYFWQFWRPVEVDLDYQTYRASIRELALSAAR